MPGACCILTCAAGGGGCGCRPTHTATLPKPVRALPPDRIGMPQGRSARKRTSYSARRQQTRRPDEERARAGRVTQQAASPMPRRRACCASVPGRRFRGPRPRSFLYSSITTRPSAQCAPTTPASESGEPIDTCDLVETWKRACLRCPAIDRSRSRTIYPNRA